MDPVLSGRRSRALRNIIFRVHSDFRKDISPGLSFHGRRGPAFDGLAKSDGLGLRIEVDLGMDVGRIE